MAVSVIRRNQPSASASLSHGGPLALLHDPVVVSTQTAFDDALAFSLDIVKGDGEDKLHKNTDARYNKRSGRTVRGMPSVGTREAMGS